MNDSTITLEAASATIDSLRKEITSLKEELAWFHRNMFGKRSEKIIQTSAQQLTFFPLEENQEVEKKQLKDIPGLLVKKKMVPKYLFQTIFL